MKKIAVLLLTVLVFILPSGIVQAEQVVFSSGDRTEKNEVPEFVSGDSMEEPKKTPIEEPVEESIEDLVRGPVEDSESMENPEEDSAEETEFFGEPIASYSTQESPQVTAEGWTYDEAMQGWLYYATDVQTGEQEPVTGWKTIKKQIFYFEESGELAGKMVTGFHSINGKDFYFKETGSAGVKGKLVTGWFHFENNLFYGRTNGSIGSKGALYTGLKKVGKETYYFKKSGAAGIKGKIVTGEVKVNSNEYYFKKTGAAGVKGKGVTGWVNLKRGRCYCSNGKILKNRYVQDYYVGKNGAMSAKSRKLYNLIHQIINQKTNSSMSKEQKLKACFDYICSRSFRYIHKREFKNEPSWKLDYAYEMLTTKSGICYNFASAFGFIARELGYSPSIIAGKISSVKGGYTVHAWVEITIGGQAYVFDASMQHGGRGNFYKKKYSQTGKTYLKP